MEPEIIMADFDENGGLIVYTKDEREDFWLDLGPCWGFFKSVFRCGSIPDRIGFNSDYPFLLKDIRMKGSEEPSPIIKEYSHLFTLNCIVSRDAPFLRLWLKEHLLDESVTV